MSNVNVNANLMVENIIQIKSEIMINAGVSVKNIYMERIIFGTLLYAVSNIYIYIYIDIYIYIYRYIDR